MLSPQEISPAEARERLEQGNRRAVAGEARKRDLPARVAALRDGQRPFAAVLGCMDSRVAPELVFDQDLGDLMSVRVAGNVVGDHVLASLEFAGQGVGVSLVVVLGHTRCAAVGASLEGEEPGVLSDLVQCIRLAAEGVSESAGPTSRTSREEAFTTAVAIRNVELGVEALRERSAVLRALEERGALALVGALYDVTTGEVEFLD